MAFALGQTRHHADSGRIRRQLQARFGCFERQGVVETFQVDAVVNHVNALASHALRDEMFFDAARHGGQMRRPLKTGFAIGRLHVRQNRRVGQARRRRSQQSGCR